MSFAKPPPLPDAGAELESGLVAVSAPPAPPRRERGLWKWGVGLWKGLVAMWLVQSPLGAILVAGWASRWMQRLGLRVWAKASQGSSWEELTRTNALARPHRHWPNWMLAQNFREAYRDAAESVGWGSVRSLIRSLFASLFLNAKRGVQLLANSCLITLPGTALMLFSWYDGWNNSFNKGYEQALVGPLLGWLGIMMFIAAMFYLPLAQARQTVTGDWRSFYDAPLLWRLVRREWLGSAVLAISYAVLALPVTVLKVVPGFFPQISPSLAQLPPEQAKAFLEGYFFWSAALFVPIYLFLHGLAAQLYARAILRGVRAGGLAEEDLRESEWRVLHQLGLILPSARSEPPRWQRAARWVATRTGQVVAGVVVFLAWFLFVGQVYIGEFLIYHPVNGFLNHPLVQLPYFHYMP